LSQLDPSANSSTTTATNASILPLHMKTLWQAAVRPRE
jgi:hypothetical protein